MKKTKGELYDYLRQKGGVVFYNADNPDLCEMVQHRTGLRLSRYGVREQGVRILPATAEAPYLQLSFEHEGQEVTISTHLVGDYNADNVMAALAIGTHFEVPFADMVKAIETYTPSNSRSQLVKTGKNTLIIDAYNANPSSMKVALRNFAATNFDNQVLMLGDMLELGPDSVAEHRQILEQAVQVTPKVFLVGSEFEAAVGLNPLPGQIRTFPTIEALKEFVTEEPLTDCTILIKGSNGKHMQRVVDAL